MMGWMPVVKSCEHILITCSFLQTFLRFSANWRHATMKNQDQYQSFKVILNCQKSNESLYFPVNRRQLIYNFSWC